MKLKKSQNLLGKIIKNQKMPKAKKQTNQKKRNRIIILAIIFSIVLYVAGVLTGLIANMIFTEQISEDIQSIKTDLDSSALDIKNIQLKQYYADNFNPEDRCDFLKVYNNHQLDLIRDFWSILPKRLEEYENNNKLTDEYISIKREYIRFSLRYWLSLTKYNSECGSSEIVPVLYFYHKDCEECIQQSKEFDIFRTNLEEDGKTLIVFPIDEEFKEDMVSILKKYYKLDSYPSTIIKNQVIVGKVIDAEELELALNI